jgi:hypothetical protein
MKMAFFKRFASKMLLFLICFYFRILGMLFDIHVLQHLILQDFAVADKTPLICTGMFFENDAHKKLI